MKAPALYPFLLFTVLTLNIFTGTVSAQNVNVSIDQASIQTDPTTASPVNFTAVFSRAVTGFTADDLSFTGSTSTGTLTAAITGGPSTYSIAVSGMKTTGTVVVGLPANKVSAQDNGAANNTSTSFDNSVQYNVVPVSVTINQAANQIDPTTASPINFTAVFSRAVTGFTAADLSFTGSTTSGTLAADISGGPTTYTIAISGMTTSGTVVVGIPASKVTAQDNGATNNASTSDDNSVQYNVVPVSVTIDQAATQVDPSDASPVNFTAVFSRAVTGFTAADLSFTGSTTSGTLTGTLTGGPTTFTIAVSGMQSSGIIVVGIPANKVTAQDNGATNSASTSTDNSVNFTFIVTALENEVEDLVIYPTLLTGQCVVRSNGDRRIKQYTVLSSTGSLVEKKVFQTTHESMVDLSHLASGMYLLQVQFDLGFKMFRIIRE